MLPYQCKRKISRIFIYKQVAIDSMVRAGLTDYKVRSAEV
jgi:hypothetical protein